MLYQKVCADCGTPLSVLTILSRFGCVMPRRSVLGTEKVFKLPFSRKKVQKSWQWYSFLRGRILCNVTHAASFFELNLNYTFHKRHFNSGWWFCACFFGNGIYEVQIVLMLLFAFSQSWTKSSKVAAVLVLPIGFPSF